MNSKENDPELENELRVEKIHKSFVTITLRRIKEKEAKKKKQRISSEFQISVQETRTNAQVTLFKPRYKCACFSSDVKKKEVKINKKNRVR